jgi:two-component system, OmpR family, response regulator
LTDTILIVDDSTFIVEGLVALLKRSYQPIPSYGGEECINILRTVHPSLIILDIMMEPMDGWETLSRIKSNPKTRHIPVLMFSAKKISPEEAEAHRIIIDDFLTKPVNPKKLLEAIDKVLARQGFNRKITETWNAAGVSPEIIDEYLSLKTNLDVDVSLLAVMKKQLEMAYPDAINREDLLRSIAALEERIEASRARIDAFCQEQAGVLPAFDKGDPVSPPVTEPLPATAQQTQPLPQPDPVAEIPEVHDQQNTPADKTPVHAVKEDSPVPIEEKISDIALHSAKTEREDMAVSEEDVQRPVTPPAPVIILPPPGPKPLFHLVPETVVNQGDQNRSDPLPADEGRSSSRIRASVDGLQKPDGEIKPSLFEPFGKPAESHPALQTLQTVAHQELGKTSRVGASAGSGHAPAANPGSGTRTPDMRSLAMTNREQKREQEDERESRKYSSEGNIFSRIFAAITGIFRRK